MGRLAWSYTRERGTPSAFKQADKKFPNHSTFDQLFDDRKFESYRALGAHTARRAIRHWMEDASKETARKVLIDVAKRRSVTTYQDLVKRTNSGVPKAVTPPPDLKPLLKEIDEREAAEQHPPLSALIVAKYGAAPRFLSRIGMRAESAQRRQREQAWGLWSAEPLPRQELSGERPGGAPQPVG